MRLVRSRRSDVPVERLRDVLQDVQGWSTWAPGITSCTLHASHAPPGTPVRHPAEVDIVLATARPLSVRLEVTPTGGDGSDGGVRFALVEGDLATLRGCIDASSGEAGTVVSIEARVEWLVSVPGMLAAELREHYPIRLLDALISYAGATVMGDDDVSAETGSGDPKTR